jgi:putative ABC transport system permease protein
MIVLIFYLLIYTALGSLREIDWDGIHINFLVVFTKGVIDDAPQFEEILTKVPSQEVSSSHAQVSLPVQACK